MNCKAMFDLDLQSCHNFVELLLSSSMRTGWIVFVKVHNFINGKVHQILIQIQSLSYLYLKTHFA